MQNVTDGDIERAVDIYSRRGAENAKEDLSIGTVFAENTCHLCARCVTARKYYDKP
jgi:hypothetical protein